MSNNLYNPIRSVDGTVVPPPSSYQWELEDISASNAGRTEDGYMHKRKIRQAVRLSLAWNNLTTAEAVTVLNAFNPEYLQISYLDPMKGNFVQSEFYVGNRSAPLQNAVTGRWTNISFNVIER